MTPSTRPPSVGLRRVSRPAPGDRQAAVEVLVCGCADRGDDGVGFVVADALRRAPIAGVRVRIVGQLQVDDLLAVPAGAGVVVVDAATGVRGGQVVKLPLTGLIDRDDRLRPRSSHALAFREVIGVAEIIRGRPLAGRIVAVGGVRFALGAGLSPSVERAVPKIVSAINAAVADLRT